MLKKITKSWWIIFCCLVLLTCLITNSLHLFKGDLLFHTDIARDFLVMDDIVTTRSPTLIGPKSGGVSGVFHGPAWYYLNLPIFALTNGNPAAIGWFWMIIFIGYLALFYYLSSRMLGNKNALTAVTLLASLTVFAPKGLMQCSPAAFLVLPFIYFTWLYLQKWKPWALVVSVLILGFIIQFQMAFGVPIAILMGSYLVYKIVKSKKWLHLLCFAAILLPLSTFILFDLRHDFLQSRSVINYFSIKNPNDDWTIIKYLSERFDSVIDCFTFLRSPNGLARIISGMVGFFALIFVGLKHKKMDEKVKSAWVISAIIIFGFWVVTIPFKDKVWGFYYEAILPLTCLWWAYLASLYKKWGMLMISLIILINVVFSVQSGLHYFKSSDIDDEVHWRFYRHLIKDIVNNNRGEDFGYFVFTPDQLGYQAKYALDYYIPTATRFKKEPITYLIIAPNDNLNPWANEDYWQSEQVRIVGEADEQWSYPSGYVVKKYYLSTDELSVEADQNLVDGLQFR